MENINKTNIGLWQKIWALIKAIVGFPAVNIKYTVHHKQIISLSPCSTPGIEIGEGRFRYIKRGKRYYIVFKLENHTGNNIIIGLCEDKDDAWIRKGGNVVKIYTEDNKNNKTPVVRKYVPRNQRSSKTCSEKIISRCEAIKV